MSAHDRSFRLDERFEAQVRRTPHSVALLDGRGSLTYADLDADSDRLAKLLRIKGIREGSFVGLHVERSISYVISVLAILKSNAAVVPLPPSYPERRLRDILSFSAPDAVIDHHDTPLGPELSDRVIHFSEAVTDSSGLPPGPPGSSHQAAFVLCSSGSTGTPKMIVRSHRSFFHRLEWTWENLPYAPGEVCCQKAHMTTTHAIYELFEPLLCGIPVWIIPDQEVMNLELFWDTIRARSISRLLIVPSMLQASLDMAGFVAPPLEVLVLMGEHVHAKLAERTLEAFSAQTRIFSIYGSTEASSTLVCDLRNSFRPGEELPLGTPLSPDVRVYLLDANLDRVAPGDVGMLHVAGSPVFTEYFKDPALTASVFVAAPDSESRMYQTHDQVRRMPDGSLCFVGRVDHVVKIRGYRVDVQEVERAVLLHPDVRQCAVVQGETGTGTSMLLAFVAPGTIARSSVFELLRERLPAYMVPSAIICLDAFPLTASGKVDRRQLLRHYSEHAPSAPPARQQTETERRISAIWREVLMHGSFQPDSSFFEAGGTSLTVYSVLHRLRDSFALDRGRLSDMSIYQFPTVEAIASHIDGLLQGGPSIAAQADSILVTLKRGSDATLPPLFLISPAGGTVGSYAKVVKALPAARDVIGVQDPFLFGDRDPTLGFVSWVSRYVTAIRERQPTGPLYILAYSSAGAFGYEIARQFRRDGRDVALLALVDPLAMDRASKRRFGYWALQSRFERRLNHRIVLLAGWLRLAIPRSLRDGGRSVGENDLAPTNAQLLQLREETRTNRGHILRLSALLELNTGLPFALSESDLLRVEPARYLDVLLARVRSVAPDLEPSAIENLVLQYELQVRAHHRYRLRRYDGRLVLFDVAGPYQGLLAAQFRPYVRELSVRVLQMGEPSPRTRALSESFPEPIRSHYLSIRDDAFSAALARELEVLLR